MQQTDRAAWTDTQGTQCGTSMTPLERTANNRQQPTLASAPVSKFSEAERIGRGRIGKRNLRMA